MRQPTDRTLEFAARLKRAMEHAKYTGDRKALAHELGISVAAVGQALTGITAFGADTNAKAADLLNVRPLWLANGEGPMEATPRRRGSALQTRLEELPEDVRTAFEAAMVNVIEAFRPSGPRTDDEAAAAMAEAKRRVEGQSARPTQKRLPARKTHSG
jgi:transcriptional regulator with XRE-family HTH domain